MNTMYKQSVLKFNSISTAFSNVYDYRINKMQLIIIEAEKYTNPTNYSKEIFKMLDLKGNEIIVVDLSNLSGVSMDSFYVWQFISENNELIDEKFKKINTLQNCEYEKYFKEYLFKKLKKVREEEQKLIL